MLKDEGVQGMPDLPAGANPDAAAFDVHHKILPSRQFQQLHQATKHELKALLPAVTTPAAGPTLAACPAKHQLPHALLCGAADT